MSVATTKMSSKGQVVIPEEIRESLGLKEGSQFVVVGRGDTVILKSIAPPPMGQFRDLLSEAQHSARKAGLRKSDLTQAVRRIRKRKWRVAV